MLRSLWYKVLPARNSSNKSLLRFECPPVCLDTEVLSIVLNLHQETRQLILQYTVSQHEKANSSYHAQADKNQRWFLSYSDKKSID